MIERHDILRTAVVWEGLPEPVQVVWREAPLAVEEVGWIRRGGDVAEQLCARFDPRHYRLDVRQAPLLRVYIAQDAAQGRWLLLLLLHHLAVDHTTLEVMQAGDPGASAGAGCAAARAAAVPQLCGAGAAGGEPGRARSVLPGDAGGCG